MDKASDAWAIHAVKDMDEEGWHLARAWVGFDRDPEDNKRPEKPWRFGFTVSENLRNSHALINHQWDKYSTGKRSVTDELGNRRLGEALSKDSTGNPVEGAPGVAHQQTPAGSRPPEVHRGPAGEGISATFRGSVLQAGELPDEAEDGTPAPTVRGLVLECENSDVLRAIATLVSQGERMFRLEVL